MIRDRQAEKYMEEAGISLKAARILLNFGDEKMYANVVKNCYDAIEQAISAALAKKDLLIPKNHPAKITKFVNSYPVEKNVEKTLFYWLRKRGFSQYVDIKNGKVVVPHEEFNKEDAQKAVSNSKEIIEYLSNLLDKINETRRNKNVE